MNSDNYEFSKSSNPQSVSAYTCYTDKQWGCLNDTNNNQYNNNAGQSPVQWDLTSIYNSNVYTDSSDLYLTLPIVMNAAFASNAATIAPGPNGYALCSLKANFLNLIHSFEVILDGKTIDQNINFINIVKNFQMLSQMSATDLGNIAPTLGMATELDNPLSMQWNTVQGVNDVGGIGLSNNRAFITNATPGSDIPLFLEAPGQNAGTVNRALAKRIGRIVDTTKGSAPATNWNGIYGPATGTGTPCIMNAQNLINEYKPYYTVSAGNIMTWYDVAVIPLKYISDALNNLGIVYN